MLAHIKFILDRGASARLAFAAVASIIMTCAAQAQQYPPYPQGYYTPPPYSPPMAPPPLDPIAAFFGALFGLPFFDGMLVPDGGGGWVPFTNSRVMPDGTLRPYDPAIDGPPPGLEPPAPPQGRSELAPPPVGSGVPPRGTPKTPQARPAMTATAGSFSLLHQIVRANDPRLTHSRRAPRACTSARALATRPWHRCPC
jgi:hypothetical protein